MSAAATLLGELRDRGIELRAVGDRLRYKPVESVDAELLERLRAHKPELLRILEPGHTAEPDPVLADSSVWAAVFHSHALDRDFVLVRDEDALRAVKGEDQKLPVLFYRDCAHVKNLGLEGLRALLDTREVFGPRVGLTVRKPSG